MAVHITTEQILELRLGELPQQQVAFVLRHLLGPCEDCRTLVRDQLVDRPAPAQGGYDMAFQRAFSTLIDREEPLAMERLAAPGLAAKILQIPFGRQQLLLHNDPRFASWGLCERLIHESRQAIWDIQSDNLLDCAMAAVQVGEALDADTYGAVHVHDLLAEAHGNLANAYRVRSEFVPSQEEFETARHLLTLGTGDESLRSQIDSLESSLLIDQGRFEEAVILLDRARNRVVPLGERQLEAKLLVKKGIALGYFDAAKAIEVQREALELIDPSTSLRLAACAKQALIWSLNSIGRSHEALMQLQGSRGLFDQFSDSWSNLHYRWTEARIALDLGQVEEAESIYRELCDRALGLDLHLETALISLDLIEIELARSRFASAATLAARLVELFSTWRVHRRAMQACRLLAEAAQKQAATKAFVGEIAQYLRRAWRNPEIEFNG